jgi:hypothetical protein
MGNKGSEHLAHSVAAARGGIAVHEPLEEDIEGHEPSVAYPTWMRASAAHRAVHWTKPGSADSYMRLHVEAELYRVSSWTYI